MDIFFSWIFVVLFPDTIHFLISKPASRTRVLIAKYLVRGVETLLVFVAPVLCLIDWWDTESWKWSPPYLFQKYILLGIMGIVFIVTVGGVLILRPLSKRFAELLESYTQDRQKGLGTELHQIRDLMETMDARLRLMEERQDFTERLLQSGMKEPTGGEQGERD